METKSLFGTLLTIGGFSTLALSVIGFFTNYIGHSFFAGAILLGCLAFFAGLTLVREHLSHD